MTPVGAAGPGANPPAASIVDAHRFEEAADAPPNDALLRTSSRQPDQRQIPAVPPTQHPESAKAEPLCISLGISRINHLAVTGACRTHQLSA